MVLSDDYTRAFTISQPSVGWMTVNRELVNDTSQGVYAYSSAVFGSKFIKDFRGINDNITTRAFAAGIYANYFMYSYYGYTGDAPIAHTGWMLALWGDQIKIR